MAHHATTRDAPTPAVLRLELFGGPVLWRGKSAIRLSPFQAALLSVAYAEGSERIRGAGCSASFGAWIAKNPSATVSASWSTR